MPFRNPGKVSAKRASLWDTCTRMSGSPFTTWAPRALDDAAVEMIAEAREHERKIADAAEDAKP